MAKAVGKIQKIQTNTWALISGIVLMLLGIYVWFHPVDAMLALALYLGLVLLMIGIGYIGISWRTQSGWYLAMGLINVFVGAIFLTNLSITAESLPIVFALWTLVLGIVQISSAFDFKIAGFPWVWPFLSGLIGILFAFLIMSYPALGMFTITMLMGSYLILYGLFGVADYIYICINCKKQS